VLRPTGRGTAKKPKFNRFLSTAQPSTMAKGSKPEERRFQMRQYELIFIVQPDLDEETTQGIVDRVNSLITDNGGKVLKTDLWGTKSLAYEIQNFRDGYYVFMEVEMEPEYGSQLTQTLRYIEPIIRHIIVKKDD
jgi:small subunit ribosomal protein S6